MNDKRRKIYTVINMLFMQDDYLFNDTLHNNDKYLKLLKRQNKLSSFLFAENDMALKQLNANKNEQTN